MARPFFPLFALSAAALATSGAAPPVAPPKPRVLAVRTLGEAAELTRAVEDSRFFRWALPGLDGWQGRVGPTARGNLELVAGLLPLGAEARALAAGLPLAFDAAGSPVFDGTPYPQESFAAAFRLPAGTDAGWLVTGRGPHEVAGLVTQVLAMETGTRLWGSDPDRRADYLLVENPWLERQGRWRPAAGGQGLEVDPAHDRDGFAGRARWYAECPEIVAGPVRLRVPPGWQTRPELRELAGMLERTLETLAPRVPLAGEPSLTVAVEADFVSQGRFTGRIGEVVLGERGGMADLHLVYDPRDLDLYRFGLARLLVRRALPQLPPWIEQGAALWLSGDWLGRPYGDWLPDLAAAGVLPTGDELLAAEEKADGSGLLWTPAAAAVVAGLPGATVVEKLRRPPGAPAVRALLEGLTGRRPTPARPAAARPDGYRPGFLHGVSFAMLNGLEVGYHAPAVTGRLDTLARLGADSISLMPFAYQGDPRRPGLRYLNRSPASETDVGLVHAARRARERGLRVLWKPHIWVGHGGWSGEIEMSDEAAWQEWWRGYRRYLVHHAVLARRAEADLLSVGVELGKTVHRQAEWRQLIEAVRRFFPGPLTYAGNWWGDADAVTFWDRLDLLGVDAYYPLSSSPEASSEELLAGAREVSRRLSELAGRHGKPLLLTEVGFASRRAAWVAPHEEGGESSEADQAAAYEALFTALGRPPWLAGVFVWKAFSADLGAWEAVRGRRAWSDFRFLGRPAEQAVRRYFTPREERRPTAR